VSDYSPLFDYNFADKLVGNKAVCAPNTIEEILIIMIIVQKKGRDQDQQAAGFLV